MSLQPGAEALYLLVMVITVNTRSDSVYDTRLVGKEEALAVLDQLDYDADCEIEVADGSASGRVCWIQIMSDDNVMVDGPGPGLLVGDPAGKGHVSILHSNGEEDDLPARFAVTKALAAEVLSAVLDGRPMDPNWKWEAYQFGDE